MGGDPSWPTDVVVHSVGKLGAGRVFGLSRKTAQATLNANHSTWRGFNEVVSPSCCRIPSIGIWAAHPDHRLAVLVECAAFAVALLVTLMAIVKLSTWFRKYGRVFQGFRSLTVAAPIRAARVSKRCFDTLANF